MASTARLVRLCMMYAVPVQIEIVMLTYRNLFFFLCRNCRIYIYIYIYIYIHIYIYTYIYIEYVLKH